MINKYPSVELDNIKLNKMENSKKYDFSNHPSLKYLSLHPYSYANHGLIALKAGKTTFSATEIEIYTANVMEKVKELENGIASLCMAKEFILAPNITPDEYRYHYENFLLRGMGIVDRSYQLVGASLLVDSETYEKLGGNCKVQKRVKTEYPNIHSALLTVANVIEPYKKVRNEVIHSKAFNNRELILFSAVEYWNIELPKDIDVNVFMQDCFTMKNDEIENVISALVNALNNLLVQLTEVYEIIHDAE